MTNNDTPQTPWNKRTAIMLAMCAAALVVLFFVGRWVFGGSNAYYAGGNKHYDLAVSSLEKAGASYYELSLFQPGSGFDVSIDKGLKSIQTANSELQLSRRAYGDQGSSSGNQLDKQSAQLSIRAVDELQKRSDILMSLLVDLRRNAKSRSSIATDLKRISQLSHTASYDLDKAIESANSGHYRDARRRCETAKKSLAGAEKLATPVASKVSGSDLDTLVAQIRKASRVADSQLEMVDAGLAGNISRYNSLVDDVNRSRTVLADINDSRILRDPFAWLTDQNDVRIKAAENRYVKAQTLKHKADAAYKAGRRTDR